MTISALYCVHNEEELIEQSIRQVLPYVDELIFIDNGCTDKTREIVESIGDDKIKIYDYKYTLPVDMGAVRTFSLEKATGDWIWQIDADEWYPNESCEAIVDACNAPGEAISFRVPYYNLAWRHGWNQSNFEHYPDRIYRRDVVEKYDGILPLDMTIVKEEFRTVKHKGIGTEGILEYDNPCDVSAWHPRQPRLEAPFFHLARTRGYNYELFKWQKYHKNIGGLTDEKAMETARVTHWVNGLYDMEKIEVPFEYGIKNPKVSVIIPNYNYNSYVGQAIKSVLAQTYPAHEIIVIDDGSWDDSVITISKYPVTLIRQSNQGVAAARNNGARQANGDYLIFLDADDRIQPRFIERCFEEMKGDVQVCYSNLAFIGEYSRNRTATRNIRSKK